MVDRKKVEELEELREELRKAIAAGDVNEVLSIHERCCSYCNEKCPYHREVELSPHSASRMKVIWTVLGI